MAFMLKRIANPDSTLMRITNPHERVTVIPRSDAESSTQARNGPVVYTGCRILVGMTVTDRLAQIRMNGRQRSLPLTYSPVSVVCVEPSLKVMS